MSDIKSPRVLYVKGGLMLVVGLLAAGLLIAETPTMKSALLLAVSVWGFCRAYYFAFYVIEHYIDPGYRYAGLVDFFRYARRHQRIDSQQKETRLQLPTRSESRGED